MAYENKYQRYLNDDDSSPSLIERINKGIVKTVGAAALIGGGYYGIKALNKAGAFKPIKEYFESDKFAKHVSKARNFFDKVEAFQEGYEETIRSAGFLRTVTGKADNELRKNFAKAATQAKMGEIRPISGYATEFEKQLYGLAEARSQHARVAIESVRLENVLTDVRKSGVTEDVYNMLADVLSKERRNKRLFSGRAEDVQKILENHNIKNKVNKAVWSGLPDQLNNILQQHVINEKYIETYKDPIRLRLEVINNQYQKSIEDLLKKRRTRSTAAEKVFGLQRLTIEKALELNVLNTPINIIEVYGLSGPKGSAKVLKGYAVNPQNIAELLKRDDQFWNRIKDAYVDPLVFINKSGSVVDLRFPGRAIERSLKYIGENIQVPFVNIRPFKMISDVFSLSNPGRLISHRVFKAGSIMPTISNSMEPLAKDYIYFNGRYIDEYGKLIKDNQFLSSAKFGAWQRATTAMIGPINPKANEVPTTTWGKIKKFLGLGYQDFESSLSRKMSAFTKFDNDKWARNIWYTMTNPNADAASRDKNLQEAFKIFYNIVENNTSKLDRDTLEVIAPYLDNIISKDTMNSLLEGSKEGIMQAINELLEADKQKYAKIEGSGLAYRGRLERILDDFLHNSQTFDEPFRTVRKGQRILTPDIIEAVNPSPTEVLTKFDEAEKILHAELLNQTKNSLGDMVNDLIKSGAAETQIDSLKDLAVLARMQNFGGSDFFPGHELSNKQLEKLAGFLQKAPKSDPVKAQLESIIFRANPILGYGPGQQYQNIFKGNDYIVLNKPSLANIKESLKEINEAFKSGKNIKESIYGLGKSLREDLVYQLGYGGKGRAGRHNMDKVSTLTLLSYYYGFRINEGLSKVGLGLSYKDMGSAQDLWMNLWLKRILAPLVAINAIRYINDEMGNITGEKPSQVASRMYANMTIGVQTIKEITGLNALGEHLTRILPGVERLGENPLGLAVKFGTFGLIGETRSPDEMREYYTTGMDPVKKGRFWSIGSSTPIYGDRIMYFQPSWYRRQEADYKMTDVLYGSTREYWANHWMPNPRNLLGLLNPFTWGHWERKHYADRPYPVYNTILTEIPLVGPVLDATIGRIAMPFRRRAGLARAHRQYLKEINELYAYYAEQSKGQYVYMSPGGRITPTNIDYSSLMEAESGEEGTPVASQDGGIIMVGPGEGFAPIESGKIISRAELANINNTIISKAYVRPASSNSIQSLRDNVFVESLEEAQDPNSLAYRLGLSYYSLTEIGGIYGFAVTSVFGDLTPRVALQSSLRMKGFERAWWDLEMGGLGGELSEMYRRFLPHRRRDIKEYNPFRNTMPDWLPGQEYFIDFKHGDPYVKIPKGEMRLPGAGYEALNRLHPDFFGEYGALDRFKILADVAPYSEQYRYYSSVVSRMHNAGLISDEDYEQVGKIRDMVAQVKKKYDFYPYKFRYADVDRTEVTVTRIIDANTFLTEEYPDAPIRLAGIRMPAKSNQSQEAEEARQLLAKYIQPGKKIKIGIDADALNRVKDDTMGTMDAVIYDAWGDSVNAKLAKRFKNVVKADWDDTDSTSVAALYSGPEITLGKVWEFFAHLDTPFHTKFLQIRSPLEMYKRKELYGKAWQSWSHPIRDILKPTLESFWSHNPIISAGLGGALGFLSAFYANKKAPFAIAGALIGGIGASIRTVGELVRREVIGNEGYTWIPKRRRVEREIDEYFDILKYVKYRGLYEKTRELAIKYEGFDPDNIANDSSNRVGSVGYIRRKLEKTKKWLKINKTHPFADEEEVQAQLDAINAALGDISANRQMMGAGPYTLRALQYRQEYMSTLYGADPYGDLQDIYRALPKKDRPFFKEFMLAKPKEREEILRLVPRNQRRFYQAKWGLKVDKKPDLAAYFMKYGLPDPTWEGWRPDVSLEAVKLKFVEKAGLEVGEFGYWKDDVEYVKDAPSISMKGGGPINVIELQRVLEGAGLRDIDIRLDVETLGEPPVNPLNIVANIFHDRKKDINKAINDNMAFFLV